MARYALIIGITKYDNFRDLHKASIDAKEVAYVLQEYGNYQVDILPKKLIEEENRWVIDRNKRLTCQELGAELRSFLLIKAKDHEAIIYFAGHGFKSTNVIGELEVFFAASNSTKDGYNALRFEDLNKLISKAQLSNLMVIIDCCYAGEIIEGRFLNSSLPIFNVEQDYFLMAACRSFERAREGKKHGIFTEAILRGLRPENSIRGKINSNRLLSFVYDELMQSGQEITYAGSGRPITIVTYPNSNQKVLQHEELSGLPNNPNFYGRFRELQTLEEWTVRDKCRVVAIYGIGGIGKTDLCAQLVQQIKQDFDYIVWKTLNNSPPVSEILKEVIAFLSEQEETNLPANTEAQISVLVENYLINRKCLLIFDNAESVLEPSTSGIYGKKTEEYGDLIKRIGETNHQSCLLLTSRERFYEIDVMEGQEAPVHSLLLSGLSVKEGRQMLSAKGTFLGTDKEWENLILHYAGNPLALKMLATPLQDLLGGNISDFSQQFQEGNLYFKGIQDLLDRQFCRLSNLEKNIIYWFAIERDWITLKAIQSNVPDFLRKEVWEGILLLKWRSMIESNRKSDSSTHFKLQPVVMEYVTNKLVDKVYEEILTGYVANESVLNTHSLLQTQIKEYVRNTQVRLIIKPVLKKLLSTLNNDKVCVHDHLYDIYLKARSLSLRQWYTAGNIINLISHLNLQLQNLNFSGVTIRQAFLQGVSVVDTSFVKSELIDCVFNQAFSRIFAVNFSPDGRSLAAGDVNGMILRWRISDGQMISSCLGHVTRIWSIAFSHNGRIFASSSDDHTIRIWDPDTGKCISIWENKYTYWVLSLCFHPNNKVLVTGSDDQTVRLWNIESGQCIKSLEGHNGRIWSVSFSPDGNYLASGGEDNIVRIWDVETGQCIKQFKNSTKWILAIAFSPDGNYLASGGEDNILRIWDIETGKCTKSLEGHNNRIWSVSFSPDGNYLASGGDDQVIRVWSIRSGKCLKTFSGHTSKIWSVSFSPDGNYLASGGDDHTVRLWDSFSGKSLHTWQGNVNKVVSVTFTSSGETLATCGYDNLVRLWNTTNAKCFLTLRGHKGCVTQTSFSPDKLILASASHDKTVRIWNVDSGECMKILYGHADKVLSVDFGLNGNRLVSGGDDNTVKIWDTSSGRCINTLYGHTNRVMSVAFSPYNYTLASGSEDTKVRIWNGETGLCTRILHGHTNRVWSIAFSPDGNHIVSGGDDKTVKLWEVSSGRCIRTFKGHTNRVWSVAFSPDGTHLATGSDDKTVKIWNILSDTYLNSFQGYGQRIKSVAFSPNAKFLAVCSEDDTVKFLSVETGKCLKTLDTPEFYSGMNIRGVSGITQAQKINLITLGAVEEL